MPTQNLISKRLELGLLPYSLIQELIHLANRCELDSVDLAQLKNVSDNEPPGLLLATNKKDIKELINSEYEICKNQQIKLTELKKTGLQVKVEFYNENGKFSYDGIVSVGDTMPHQNGFYEKIKKEQCIIKKSAYNTFDVVISSTILNECDRNYNIFVGRIIRSKFF